MLLCVHHRNILQRQQNEKKKNIAKILERMMTITFLKKCQLLNI